MAKQHKAKKPENLGKGKVTPVQIAFIVDRYLADNNYTATLSAFRAETSDLFFKTKGKEVPKGLLGLGEILDEYISLKEQKVMVDQEKRRVEMALQGMQDVMRAYHSAGNPALPPSPPLLPSQFMATPMAPVLPVFCPTSGSGSPPGHVVVRSPVMNTAQQPIVPPHIETEPNNSSTPIHNSSSANKRKASKSASKVPSAPKRKRTEPPTKSSMVEGDTQRPKQMQIPIMIPFLPLFVLSDNVLISDVTCTNVSHETQKSAVRSTSNHLMIKSPAQGYSVAKSLFKQSPDSSPKTPPQALPSQPDKFASPPEKPSFQKTSVIKSQEIASSKISLVASETIIVSPLKGEGYYAVERSYHITSPYKSSPRKLSKREHVKGKLDFEEPDVPVPMSSAKTVVADCSISSTEVEMPGSFDFDLPDFDILDGDFSFSELLADMDIDFEGIPSCQLRSGDSIPGPGNNLCSECLETNQTLPDSSLSTSSVLSEKETSIQAKSFTS
ncbi:polycystic kidney disease protein 1-like 3 [Cocos nucifera]|uniref:Polycystic kidney disease protein 1-like 3 n=1 Tax=Cocos nucifera TaxID=13894 RepID=A0A8K0I4N1_COCNU|nr:polycystic kidney disease protein 1-like 3 [Cocos nucifera]